jgi:AcrR family transcriptional regulator
MPRWRPDGRERLQEAAVELFRERGYEAVTVAEIAARAGLTKRTFFNHFNDKRDVLFAGAADLEAEVLRRLRDANSTASPFDVAIEALGRAGQTLSEFAPYTSLRRELIDSSTELRERDLMKSASLSSAIAAELEARGAASRVAAFAALCAVAVFGVAYDDWADAPETNFIALITATADDLQKAVAVTPPG